MHPYASSLLGAAAVTAGIAFHLPREASPAAEEVLAWLYKRPQYSLALCALGLVIGALLFGIRRRSSLLAEWATRVAPHAGGFYGSAAGASLGWLTGRLALQVAGLPVVKWPPYVAVYALFVLIAVVPLVGLYLVPSAIAEFQDRRFRRQVGAVAVQWCGLVLMLLSVFAAAYDTVRT
jgi:hypothetical protein